MWEFETTENLGQGWLTLNSQEDGERGDENYRNTTALLLICWEY